MTQIFIFTAGQSAARSHLDDSIISPVDLSKLEGNFLESTGEQDNLMNSCLLYTSPSPRDNTTSRMPSSA